MLEIQEEVDKAVNDLINGKTLSIIDNDVRKGVQTKLK